VLLNSDSSISIFNSAYMLDDIHEVNPPLVLESNSGGHQVTSKMGSIKNFGKVWYNPDSMANILSLAEVRKVRRVTMDSDADAALHVHLLDGSCIYDSRSTNRASTCMTPQKEQPPTIMRQLTITKKLSVTPICKP
jgi:hypothetical protein